MPGGSLLRDMGAPFACTHEWFRNKDSYNVPGRHVFSGMIASAMLIMERPAVSVDIGMCTGLLQRFPGLPSEIIANFAVLFQER